MGDGDPVTEAFKAIRRISRIADLELIQSVIQSRRAELNSMTGPRRTAATTRPRGRGVRTSVERLDPAHRRDPVYLEYKSAERDLTAEMLRLGLNRRSAVTGEARDRFNRALEAWRQRKPAFKAGRRVSSDAGEPGRTAQAVPAPAGNVQGGPQSGLTAGLPKTGLTSP